MKSYDKLVRDNIPDMIKKSGKQCDIDIIKDDRILEYLYVKLHEEIFELLDSENLDEIADVLEVVFSIGKRYGFTEDEMLIKRNEKKSQSGGFENHILLKNVY